MGKCVLYRTYSTSTTTTTATTALQHVDPPPSLFRRETDVRLQQLICCGGGERDAAHLYLGDTASLGAG